MIPFIRGRSWNVVEDMKPFLHPLTPWGKQEVLPNLVEVTDPKAILEAISNHKQVHKWHDVAIKYPGKPNSEYVNLYLMANADGTNWNGTGVVITTNIYRGHVFRFALCKHEKTEEGHNPNHSRGWHPGHCKHCGMDMTVDSGD